jgi:glycolate oxidase FAD binding subunit
MDAGLSSKRSSAVGWEEQVVAIVGRDHVRAATGPAVTNAPHVVIEPANEQELARVLALANEAGLAVIPRGGGTKLDWGNPPGRVDMVLSTARLNRVIEHAWADLVVTVEAGCTIQTVQTTLAKYGQRIACDPLWPDRATVGGVLSMNDSGALRLRYGALRDLIIGVTLALPDGTLASSGGKVVKNVAGYDLPKLATGALGTLGIITRAIFRLHPLSKQSLTLTIETPDPETTQRAILSIQDSKLAHSALQARFSADASPKLDILLEGTTAGIVGQRTELTTLIAPLASTEADSAVWQARQQLFTPDAGATAIAKLSVLPASIAATAALMEHAAQGHHVRWSAVLQATGIGWLRLEGATPNISSALASLRSAIEKEQGSLTALRKPPEMAFDAWGNVGDALPLMRALKREFDPRGTLNPGLFVGGI